MKLIIFKLNHYKESYNVEEVTMKDFEVLTFNHQSTHLIDVNISIFV